MDDGSSWAFDAWRMIRGLNEPTAAPVCHILVLHGYASNSSAFMSRHLRELRQFMPSVKLSAPDGPSAVNDRGSQRAWWLFDPMFPMDRAVQQDWWQRAEVAYLGAEANVDSLVDMWRNGGFDGIMGFSQGATMAALLCARLEQLAVPGPRFAILVAGFRSPEPSNEGLRWFCGLTPSALHSPALVISGEQDTAVPPARVAALAELFAQRTEHMVLGGQHAMPRREADLRVISEFVARVMTLAEESLSDERARQRARVASPPPSPPSSPLPLPTQLPSLSSTPPLPAMTPLLALSPDLLGILAERLSLTSTDSLLAAHATCHTLHQALGPAVREAHAVFDQVCSFCAKVNGPGTFSAAEAEALGLGALPRLLPPGVIHPAPRLAPESKSHRQTHGGVLGGVDWQAYVQSAQAYVQNDDEPILIIDQCTLSQPDGHFLDWCRRSFDASDMACFVRSVEIAMSGRGRPVCTAIMSIALSFNPIGDVGVTLLATMLKDLPCLHRLELQDCRIGDAGVSALARCLTSWQPDEGRASGPYLRRLCLGSNPIADAGCEELARTLSWPQLSCLAVLQLGDTVVGDLGACALASALENGGMLWGKQLWLAATRISSVGRNRLNAAAVMHTPKMRICW